MTSKQPKSDYYRQENNINFNLWIDYWYQQDLISKTNSKSILEIGKGTGMFETVMKKRGFKYTSADIDKNLNPDIVCDVTKIPINDNNYDCVCAFQVLEHIPFSKFKKGLIELRRVSKKYIIISLPYACFYISFAFQPFYATFFDPLFKFFRLKSFEPIYVNFYIPFFFLKKMGMIKPHYWEMGRKGFSINRIRKTISNSGLEIESEKSRIFYPYHHFFVLKKK